MLENIFISLCKIYAPSREEHDMLSYVEGFLLQHNISFQSDIVWGIHALLPAKAKNRTNEHKKDILLMAHVDSAETTRASCSSIKYHEDRNAFLYTPTVGLDDKTGLAVILHIVYLYATGELPSLEYNIQIFFSTKEEIGQQGLLLAPLQNIVNYKNIRYGICIDRKTNRHPQGYRHIVNNYCGIPLLETDACLLLFQQAAKQLGLPTIYECSSPYCADALELRIQINVEMFFSPQNQAQQNLYNAYYQITEQIRNLAQAGQSIGSFTSGIRATRYDIARKIISQMPNTGVCICNLSMDYEENGVFSAKELRDTVLLIKQFLLQY